MKYPITIDGKEYEFTVNRHALKELKLGTITGAEGLDPVDMLESMFYAFINIKNPMSKEEAMVLLDKAEEEYGFNYLSEAMAKISNEGFTSNGKSKIAWMETNNK